MSFAELFPHRVKIRDTNRTVQTFIWLIENVGLSNYSFQEGEYCFKHEEDYTLFILRWA